MTEQDKQRTCDGHTAQPDGYIAWHAWAADMAKTHDQRQCTECGLYAIWEPRHQPKGPTT
ncbi:MULTISPECIES: hypothetical protein [Sphingomonadales]|jgi:hypothetical protein|uniref:hypothetical protein n=1 Tax=Sphingomonadales TaxID=204457 RepID=UPI00082A6B23|nr:MULTISPECIES: hypothetical protein [Sphingomonadales]